MNIKKLIDSHPFFLIIGISLAVAGTTAAVVNYLSEKSVLIEKAQHEFEMSKIQERLVGIERKIGDGTDFFDVSRLVISQDEIKRLGPEYRSLQEGGFFVTEPDMTGWTYSLTSEFDFAKMALSGDEDFEESLASLARAMSAKNVHLWRNERGIKFHSPQSHEIEFNAFPYVVVQYIRIEDLKTLIAGVSQALDRTADYKSIDEVIQKIKSEIEDAKPLVQKLEEDEASRKARASTRSDFVSTSQQDNNVDSTAAKMEIESELDDLFRGDLATLFLSGFCQQFMMTSTIYPGAVSEIRALQKKANVIYLRAIVHFPNPVISDNTVAKELNYDMEFFVLTNADSVYVVKTMVPSADGRSAAFSWASAFLSGLRIPVRAVR